MKQESNKTTKQQNNNAGFTLIELMVSISVFSIVVVLMSGMLVTSLRGQEKGFTAQNVADNIRYAMEVMAKEVRMGSAFTQNNANEIQFTSNMPHRNGSPIRFFLQGGRVMFDDNISPGDVVPAEAITAVNVAVSSLRFDLTGTGAASHIRLIIVLEAASAGTAADVATSINVQTTISPRIL